MPEQGPGVPGGPGSHPEYTGPDQAQWAQDRETEARSLPSAGQGHYASEHDRQLDLEVAAQVNIAKMAGEIGATVPELQAMRAERVAASLPIVDFTEADVLAFRQRHAMNQNRQQ